METSNGVYQSSYFPLSTFAFAEIHDAFHLVRTELQLLTRSARLLTLSSVLLIFRISVNAASPTPPCAQCQAPPLNFSPGFRICSLHFPFSSSTLTSMGNLNYNMSQTKFLIFPPPCFLLLLLKSTKDQSILSGVQGKF